MKPYVAFVLAAALLLALPAASRRLDEQQRQEILRADGPFQLVAEHEIEGLWRQHAGILIEERIGSHQEALSSSASLIL